MNKGPLVEVVEIVKYSRNCLCYFESFIMFS